MTCRRVAPGLQVALRPEGLRVQRSTSESSVPVSFMNSEQSNEVEPRERQQWDTVTNGRRTVI